MGLTLNSTKAECTLLNEKSTGNEIHTFNGTSLNTADNFIYLQSCIKDSKKDFNIHKALVWSACNKLHLIWKSNISKDTKLAFFWASVESILLYRAETWTMKKDLEKHLMVCIQGYLWAQNLSWKDQHTLADIYGNITPISRPLICQALFLWQKYNHIWLNFMEASITQKRKTSCQLHWCSLSWH